MDRSSPPYHPGYTTPLEYHGPEGDLADPEGVDEVRIGYFGPSDSENREAGNLWTAAVAAVERLNANGGYRGLPFRLIPGWSSNPWGSGVSLVARMVYDEGVWAIVGSIDGPSTHLAEQVVAKARVTLISAASIDGTVNLAYVPWMFSCLPSEKEIVPPLVGAVLEEVGNAPYLVFTGTDHDSRVLSRAFLKELGLRGSSPELHLEIDSHTLRKIRLPGILAGHPLRAVVILADPEMSATLVREIRKSFEGQIFGGPAAGRTLFLKNAGASALGLRFPLPFSLVPTSSSSAKLRLPESDLDFAARQTYDAIILLGEAIRKAGLNRSRIREAVQSLSPWKGTFSRIEWDAVGQNRQPVTICQIGSDRSINCPKPAGF